LTPTEVRNVLQYVEDTAHLIARLLYGSGMRLQECLRLRVKDIDFGNPHYRAIGKRCE
jgi:integrase